MSSMSRKQNDFNKYSKHNYTSFNSLNIRVCFSSPDNHFCNTLLSSFFTIIFLIQIFTSVYTLF